MKLKVKKIPDERLEQALREKFQVEDFIVTHHALRRFIERYRVLSGRDPEDPRRMLYEFLIQSKRKNPKRYERLMAILNNNCERAKYWYFRKWRFVIIDSGPGQKSLKTSTLDFPLSKLKR